MADRLIDDASFEPDDLQFDELLRERLARASVDHSDETGATLSALRPRFVRARRVRRAQLAAIIGTPLVVIAVVAVALSQLMASVDRQPTVAAQPDATSAVDDTTRATATSIDQTADDGAGTVLDSDQAPTGSARQDPVEPENTPTSTTGPTTATSTGQTTLPSSSEGETTAGPTSTPGSESGRTACGEIIVRVRDGMAELVETRPEPGHEVDIKSSGPEVEVSFEREGSHCEIRAEVEQGVLVFTEDSEGN